MILRSSIEGYLDPSIIKILSGYKKNNKKGTKRNSIKTCEKTLSKP